MMHNLVSTVKQVVTLDFNSCRRFLRKPNVAEASEEFGKLSV